MRVLRGLGFVLAIVLLLVAVAVASLFTTTGRQAVRHELASWLTTQLGRTVRIDGDMNLHLGRSVMMSASDVHLANVAWASRADMLAAAQVVVVIDAISLLSRSPTLIVNQIRIDGLDLLLERNADGNDNWQFDMPPSEPGPPWLANLPFVVEKVALPGAHVVFIGPRLDRPLDLRFDEINQQHGKGDMLDISANGQANGTNLRITGEIGPFANLIAARAFSTSIDASLGELSLSIKARVDSLANPVDSEADIELNGPDAAYVASTLGVRNLGNGPFNLAFSVSPAPDGKGVRGSVVGKIGEFDISGDGELSDPTEMGNLTLRTEISGPDVSLLAGIAGFDRLPPERFHLVATVRRTGSLLQIDQAELELPDSALSVRGSVARIDKFSGNDLTMRINGASLEKFRKLLHVPGMATGPFDITGTMHRGQTGEDILDLAATTTLARVTATGPLGAYPEYFGTRLQFSVSGANVQPFAQQVGLTNAPRAPFSAQGQFEWAPSGVVLHGAKLSVGDDTLNVDGPIGKAPGFDTAVRFGLQGKSLESVGNIAGWTGLPRQPYKAAGQFQRQSGRIRLEGVDVTAAGARLQVGGTFANDPKQDTTLNFTTDGNDLHPFAPLAPDVKLPTGPFRAQGAIAYRRDRVRLDKVGFTVAGSSGTITTDLALPLGTSVSGRPNEFDVRASGPNLRLLVPDAPNSPVVNQKFDLRAKGLWNRDSWAFESLHFDTPGGFVNVQGTFDRAPDYSATAMSVQARTANLAATGRLFGIPLPAQPLDFAATISGTPNSFRMQQLTGHFGRTDFSGSVALDLSAKPDLDIHLKSNFLDLTPLTDSVMGTESVTPVKSDGRTIPNIALPMDLLNKIDAQASIQSAKANFFDQTYDQLELNGVLKNGRLTLDPLAFGSAAGNLTMQVAVGPDLTSPNVRLVANGDHIRLAVVPGMNRTAAASLYKVQINVAATGLNLRDLAATLNGQVRLIGEGGRIPNSRMSVLTSDFLGELTRTLNPLSKRQEFTDVVCQAYLFDATSGVLKTDPVIVVRTADLDIISNGSVDLRNEAIDFNFKTSARGGLGFSAGELLNAYVKVSGTLSKPYLTVDPKGTLVNGGAAFATGGLSILATTLWDRFTRQSDPCAAAVAEADKRASTKKSWW
jgi:uncharacterized protein involved in outer membrane biogenesis